MFGRGSLHLLQKLKPLFNSIPKSKARYRKTSNRYKTLFSLNCYFDEVATMKKVAEKLQDENLWRVTLSANDQKLTPQCLIESVQKL